MDIALKFVTTRLIIIADLSVSILILMDIALKSPKIAHLQAKTAHVSILILMDIALKCVRCSNGLITNIITVFCSDSLFVKQYVKEPY